MKEWIIWVAAAVVLIVVFLIVLVKLKKKKKQRQELEQLAEEKLREEALDRLILNQKAENESIKATSQQPYLTRYSSTKNQDFSGVQKSNGSKLMLKVEEIGAFSRREFMLDPEHLISIGAGSENTISLPGMNIDNKQCEIGMIGADKFSIYVRNIGEANVVLARKKNRTPINRGWVQLINGDELMIADVKLKLTIIKTKQGGRE